MTSVSYDTWWTCTDDGPITELQTTVRFSHANNVRPNDALKPQLEAIWADRKRANPRLFNGSKFRLVDVFDQTNGGVVLSLGLCDYKTYLATNCADEVTRAQLREQAVVDAGDERAYLADPLGVNAVVLTSDDKMVMMKRSEHTGELMGWYDMPGGHPEPKSVGIEFQVGKTTEDTCTAEPTTVDRTAEIANGNQPSEHANQVAEAQLRARILHEVFDSIIEEVVGEINIPRDRLSEPSLLGVTRQHHSGGRPCASFLMRTTLNASQVEQRYIQGGTESDESTSLVLVPIGVVLSDGNEGMCDKVDPKGRRERVSLGSILPTLTPSACFGLEKVRQGCCK